MVDFFLLPLATWLGVSIPVLLLLIIAICSIVSILRG